MRQIHFVYFPTYRKDGKRAKRDAMIIAYSSKLNQCERCGRVSSADWVKRWYYRRFDRNDPTPDQILCIGCFNQLRPLWRADREAWELAALARKLKREVQRVRRDSENHG